MVGFFDSGIGGRCVLDAFRRLCPDEPTVYFADTENCPYGNKPPEEIVRRSKEIAADLIAQGCRLHTLGHFIGHKGHSASLIPHQQVFQSAGILFRTAMNNGQVLFFELILTDLSGKLGRGLRITGKHHQAADHPVQPMDSSHICRRITQGLSHQVRHTAGFIGRQDSGRLDTNHYVIVTIDQFHGALPMFFLILPRIPPFFK